MIRLVVLRASLGNVARRGIKPLKTKRFSAGRSAWVDGFAERPLNARAAYFSPFFTPKRHFSGLKGIA